MEFLSRYVKNGGYYVRYRHWASYQTVRNLHAVNFIVKINHVTLQEAGGDQNATVTNENDFFRRSLDGSSTRF